MQVQPNTERNEGTFSKYASLDDEFDGFHYYLAYKIWYREQLNTAHEIRDKRISRDEGIALVKKYDGEFPKNILKISNYCLLMKKLLKKLLIVGGQSIFGIKTILTLGS